MLRVSQRSTLCHLARIQQGLYYHSTRLGATQQGYSRDYTTIQHVWVPLSKDTAGIILPFNTFGCHSARIQQGLYYHSTRLGATQQGYSRYYTTIQHVWVPLSKDTAGIILPFNTFGCHSTGIQQGLYYHSTRLGATQQGYSRDYTTIQHVWVPLSKNTAGIILPFNTFGCHSAMIQQGLYYHSTRLGATQQEYCRDYTTIQHVWVPLSKNTAGIILPFNTFGCHSARIQQGLYYHSTRLGATQQEYSRDYTTIQHV